LVSLLGDDDNHVRESARDTVTTWLKHGEHPRFSFDCAADDTRAIVPKLKMAQKIVAILNSEHWTKRQSALLVLIWFTKHGENPHQ
jgi:hypothetical protein